MFWLDKLINNLDKEKSYLVNDAFTPSGKAHIGSLRGVLIHDAIFRALKKSNIKAEFHFIFDDFDPMDGLPIYLDEKVYSKFMGMPLSNVPAPDGKSKSFGDQFGQEFLKVINDVDASPKIYWSSEIYKKSQFNKTIKIALDNASKVREIYFKISGSKKDESWYPFQSICQNCGRIGTTKVLNWDGEEVEYICQKDLVEWAFGCGYQGKMTPYDGNGKLPWKVEWPATWKTFKVDIEGEGKDHAAAGGARDVANSLAREIFSINPPYDIPYEHFLTLGKKMSSSAGLGVLAHEIAELLPTEVLRFLMIKNPKRPIEFDPKGNTISNLFDEYDKAYRAYKQEINFPDLGQAFLYSQVQKPPRIDYLPRFLKLAYSVQMPRIDILKQAEEEKRGKLLEEEKQILKGRVTYVKKWLQSYASDDFKFEVQEKLPLTAKNLTQSQKEFLSKLKNILKKAEWKGDLLHTQIHDLKNELGIDPQNAFSAIYLIFLGKYSGPQAGWLLASLDKKFVLTRFEEATKK